MNEYPLSVRPVVSRRVPSSSSSLTHTTRLIARTGTREGHLSQASALGVKDGPGQDLGQASALSPSVQWHGGTPGTTGNSMQECRCKGSQSIPPPAYDTTERNTRRLARNPPSPAVPQCSPKRRALFFEPPFITNDI